MDVCAGRCRKRLVHGRSTRSLERTRKMDAFLAYAQFWAAPIIMFAVSAAYFSADREPRVSRRIIASAHGAVAAAIYFGAVAIHWAGKSRVAFDLPYLALMLIPVALIIASFFKFRGPRIVHVLQFLNVPALVWSLFIGEMAITGEWL